MSEVAVNGTRSTGPGTAHWLPGRTALYRLFDAASRLLYIGISANPEARFGSHESTQPWWPQVDMSKTTVEWLDTRREAEAAEDAAILAERPLHNVAGSPWAPKPRQLGDGEMSLGDAKANFTDTLNRVRLKREAVFIVRPTRNREPQAALVPFELAQAAEAAGGVDVATEILRKSLTATTAP
jgi:predicted GIY-YIG superfamily endonuclease